MTSIYLVIAILAFALMFATIETDSLSGIFVVVVALPLTAFLTQILDTIGIDSVAIKSTFMALGVLFNSFVIYLFFSFITRNN